MSRPAIVACESRFVPYDTPRSIMAKVKRGSETEGVNSFRFNLMGLIVFSLVLVAGAASITARLLNPASKPPYYFSRPIPGPEDEDRTLYVRKGPWGELLLQTINLERPAEYFADETTEPIPETWTFPDMTMADARAVLAAGGLSPAQVERVMSGAVADSGQSNAVVVPDEEFLLSLEPESREKLFLSLKGKGIYEFIDFPYIFPNKSIEVVYDRLHPDDAALLKKLVYTAGGATRLTDYNVLLRRIPTAGRRITAARALSLEPAVLARLCIRPDTDIEKIASYWGHMDNVRFNDIRPVLEALKRLPQGGTASLMLFMPPFAREHLYTYPLPPKPGEVQPDCHWSTFNFSLEETDDRFSKPEFTVAYLKSNYYQVGSPSVYGDLLLYPNEKGEIKHSAVYIADDLAFTKYGNNFHQPWLIVHLSDMQAMYANSKPLCYRRKTS